MHGTSMGCLLVHLAMLCAVSAWNLPDESTMTGETTKERTAHRNGGSFTTLGRDSRHS